MNRILSLIGVVLVVGCGPEPRDMETLQEVDGVLKSAVDGHLTCPQLWYHSLC